MFYIHIKGSHFLQFPTLKLYIIFGQNEHAVVAEV